ncbi:CipC1 protein [Mycena polygramma]|nr:CipC1 protein [Mycena polygramma]
MYCLPLNLNSTNLGLFSLRSKSKEAKAYKRISSTHIHKSRMSHQLLANAASFVAACEFEKHCEANGRPQSHAEAKALRAGFAGAFIDKEIENRGLDLIDKQKVKFDALSASVLAYARNRSL